MSFQFSEKKATQAAATLLELTEGSSMSYLKLIKLLYIADRESLRESGAPITGDWCVAMKHGPVLSYIYDLIRGEAPEDGDEEYWCNHLETSNHDIKLRMEPGKSELSEYEIQKLEEVFEEYRDVDQWRLRDITHEFPEWKKNNPGTSSRKIPLADILIAVGRAEDIEEIEQEQVEDAYFQKLFGS